MSDTKVNLKSPAKVGRPTSSPEGVADAQIQLRVTRARKGAYVASARKRNESLAGWAFRHLDKASGFSD